MRDKFKLLCCHDGLILPSFFCNRQSHDEYHPITERLSVRGNRTLFCTNGYHYDLYIPVTFIGRIKACDIAQSFVTCRVGEQCDESTAMCV